MSNRILFVTNYPDSAWAAKVVPDLKGLGELMIQTENETLNMVESVESLACELVVIDASGVQMALAELVDKLCCEKQKRAVVVATSVPSWRLAREVFQAGAANYIPRSLDTESLLSACQRALARLQVADTTILLADNKPEYLDSMAQILESEGFTVLRAHNPATAKRCLETAVVHLALIDLRLSDDEDIQDNSGIELARSVMRSVPKLILTRFPDYKAAVDALKPDDIYDLPPAVDFVYKLDGTDVILTAVHEALHKFVDGREERTIILARLRDLILEGFNLSELRSVCMDLSLNYEQLSGQTITDRVIELIYYFQRRRLLLVLVNVCQQKRPSLPWQSVYQMR